MKIKKEYLILILIIIGLNLFCFSRLRAGEDGRRDDRDRARPQS